MKRAAHLKLTAQDLSGFGIVDEIVPEPLGGAHRDAGGTIARVLKDCWVGVGRAHRSSARPSARGTIFEVSAYGVP